MEPRLGGCRRRRDRRRRRRLDDHDHSLSCISHVVLLPQSRFLAPIGLEAGYRGFELGLLLGEVRELRLGLFLERCRLLFLAIDVLDAGGGDKDEQKEPHEHKAPHEDAHRVPPFA